MDYQKLLLEHLDLVDRSSRVIARRHHLASADCDEFLSIVRFKLIDRDFAILRKFQGRSNLTTYLMTVIERIYLDFCITRWGKWRPSAAARRLGPVAMLLEQFLGRDGMTFDEAVGTLQTNHGVIETREALHAMFLELPPRFVRRWSSEEELAVVAARRGASDRDLHRADDQEIADRIEAALTVALAGLSPREQLILKLRFQDDRPVAEIARLLQCESKPLYRKLQDLIGLLRDKLRQEGIDQTDIDRVVGHPAISLGRVLAPPTAGLPGNLGEEDDGSV